MLAFSLPSAILSHPVPVEKPDGLIDVDDIIYQPICKMSRTYGKSPDEVSKQYFSTIHQCLPTISKEQCHTYLHLFVAPTGPICATVSLAKCLTTSKADSSSVPWGSVQEALYLITENLLLHARTVGRISIVLIHARLLMAIFEYACEMKGVVYVSIALQLAIYVDSYVYFDFALNIKIVTLTVRRRSNTGHKRVHEIVKANLNAYISIDWNDIHVTITIAKSKVLGLSQ